MTPSGRILEDENVWWRLEEALYVDEIVEETR
jgi:hypothetical protein